MEPYAQEPGGDPIAAEFAHVSGYNYAENDPVASVDLWGLQEAEPPSQMRMSSQDLLQTPPLESAPQIRDPALYGLPPSRQSPGFFYWIQGSPQASDFHDNSTPSNIPGVTILSNSDWLKSQGTLGTPDGTSVLILEENEVTQLIPAGAGGVTGDLVKGVKGAENAYNVGIGLSKLSDALDVYDNGRVGPPLIRDTFIVCPGCGDTVPTYLNDNHHFMKGSPVMYRLQQNYDTIIDPPYEY